MREDLANHGGLLDGDDDLQGATTQAVFDVDVEDALQSKGRIWPA